MSISAPRKEANRTCVVSEAVQDVYCLERDHEIEHVVILALARRSSILNC